METAIWIPWQASFASAKTEYVGVGGALNMPQASAKCSATPGEEEEEDISSSAFFECGRYRNQKFWSKLQWFTRFVLVVAQFLSECGGFLKWGVPHLNIHLEIDSPLSTIQLAISVYGNLHMLKKQLPPWTNPTGCSGSPARRDGLQPWQFEIHCW